MKIDIEREEISTLLLALDIVWRQYEGNQAQQTLVRDAQSLYRKFFEIASNK